MSHSIAPVMGHDRTQRPTVGTSQCAKPYRPALLNISAMSFGSLGANAIEALNLGARLGDFYHDTGERSEEHTSELQSLMRISYAVFCLKKKTPTKTHTIDKPHMFKQPNQDNNNI